MPRIFSTRWAQAEHELRALRSEVFVREQQVPEALEWEEDDHVATHFLAFRGATAIATARLLPSGQIGRMAVVREQRGQGIGRQLLLAVLAHARTAGQQRLFLHAQTHALGFYQGLGFEAEGEEFDDAGIPHRAMRLVHVPELPEPPPALPRLGADDALFGIPGETDAYQLHAWLLSRQAERSVRLYSPTLDAAVFDHPALQEALSTLARRGRQTWIRIILRDPRRIVGRRHRLVELARRLSSTIEIRRAPEREQDGPDNGYLLADASGLLWMPEESGQRGYACYHHPGRVRELARDFDALWEHSEPEPELRQLGL